MMVETAADIVTATVRAATPEAPPLIREVTRAVFNGRRPRTIYAEVILFDGKPAKLRLERWAHGWGFGWDEMTGGACSLEGNEWRRVPEECAHCAGRGFQYDWIDQGGAMRAVPGDTCRHCDGSGTQGNGPAQAASDGGNGQ